MTRLSPPPEQHEPRLLEQLPDLVWATDTDFEVTLCLRKDHALGSLHTSPVVGSALTDLFASQGPSFPAIAQRSRVSRGETLAFAQEYQGAVHDFVVRPLQRADGQFAGSLGVAFNQAARNVARDYLQSGSAQLAVLHDVGQALNRLAEPLQVLTKIHAALGRVLDNTNFFIALYDATKQFITFPVYVIDGQPVARESRPFGNGISEYVIRTRAPLLIPANLAEESAKRGIERMGRPGKCILAVPLRAGEKILGVMCVQDYQRENTFDGTHLDLLTTFAAQAALALENARLFQEVQDELAGRKQVEETLRQHTDRLREAQAIAHVGSFHWEVASNKVAWSDELYRIYGFQPGEIEPTYESYLARVHPEHRSQVQRAVEHTFQTHEPFEHQYRIVRPSGEVRWVFARGGAVINSAGQTIALEGICQDITERKGLEEQFHQAQRLAAIGQMAGGVAHNFNNILTIITGYASLLQAELQPGHRLLGFADEIARAAERAATLTRQILAFSRKQVLQPKVLNLNLVVAAAQEMLRGLIPEHVQIVPELDAALWPAKVDELRLEEALLNLGVNARDAMPEGGKLTIASTNVQLHQPKAAFHATMPPGRYVCLRVSDTGCGMDAQVKSHLFEPFFTTKPIGQGTGLGLPSVYGIVQQSDGFIAVESELGHGTTVSLYFPAAQETVAPAREATPRVTTPPAGGTETVLLVEDDASVRGMVRQLLSERGYQILEAHHGADALQLARKHQGTISLVVTDVVMPKMNGPEFVEQLRAERPNVKVIYVSGHSDSILRRRHLVNAEFLAKPFTPEVLAASIRRLLG